MNLVANQSSYSLPTDFLILRSLRYKYSDMLSYSALKYQSMQQFDEIMDGWDGTAYGTDNPYYYTVDSGSLILFPTPSQSVTNGLKILYNKKPTDVVLTSDALSLPLIYHNTIVKYCLWNASLLDEDNEPAVMHQNNFEEDTRLLLARESIDKTSTYPTITTLEDDL